MLNGSKSPQFIFNMKFIRCVIYLVLLGVASFFVGRLLAKFCRFSVDKFPFKCYKFENKFYIFIRLPKWQNKLPDMSRILPKMVPPKKMSKVNEASIDRMVQETCVAELIHFILCVCGFGCVFIWEGGGGTLISIIYCLANLPCLFAQRYNRPRLLRLSSLLNKAWGESDVCGC